MLNRKNPQRRYRPGFGTATLLAVLMTGTLRTNLAAATDGLIFDSPEDAARALYQAVQTNNQSAVARLIGPLASSDDVVQDKADRDRFVQKYSEMHRFVQRADGTTELYIGAENWPFPVPLISRKGKWSFDVDAGAREIMFRRVGEDETTAIETTRAIARAIGHPDVTTGDPATDAYVRQLVGAANSPEDSFHGYQFRTLQTPSGAVIVAYPSQYGVTGVMTFAASPDGAVYEKNFGPKTSEAASAMVRYQRDRSWQVAEQ